MTVHSTTDQTLIKLTGRLIERRSVSPDDAGCQDILYAALAPLGFQRVQYDFADVKNLWAVKEGNEPGPTLIFAGHTDVVPSGPTDAWSYDPYTLTVVQDVIYGRGAADMKGALAAMMLAAERFVADHPDFKGRLGFLITSDEEAKATHGTKLAIQALKDQGAAIDFAIVGEPSSSEVLGDTIRVGRRGSLNGTLTVKGQQGHVAYPETVINPIHLAAIAIEKLLATPLDQGHGAFPPSTLQVTNIHAGTGATNVVPGDCCVEFNFRFNTAWNASSLKDWTETRLDAVLDKYDLQWTLSGDPFLTNEGELLSVVDDAIQSVCGITPIHSTGGGTSDGRFLAPHDIDVVEVGVTNGTIHKVDERVAVSELRGLCDIYYQIMQTLLAPK